MSNNSLKQKYEWALKEEARVLLLELVELGIDKDLAFAIMEEKLPESSIYNLPSDENE